MAETAETETVTIRYFDARGHKQEIRVSRAMGRAIRAIRAAAWRQTKKWEKRHSAFSAIGIDDDLVAEKAGSAPNKTGFWWEGPRFSFTLLLGLSQPWPLGPRPDGTCPGRGGGELLSHVYCLGCDRSGRDRDIAGPTRADLIARARMPVEGPKPDPGGLAGGTGKAPGKAKRKGKPPKARKNQFDLKQLGAALGRPRA